MGLLDQADEAEAPQAEDDDKSRLFQTVRRMPDSSRGYLKVLAIVVLIVIVGVVAFFYLTLPGEGDVVAAPNGLDLAVRNQVLEKEKRVATDITFYKCTGFYWARVGVETRNDIQNPIFKLDKYIARATEQSDGVWDVKPAPVTSPDMDIPCKSN